MRRKTVRVAMCHPDRMHHAKGLCKNCYQERINHEVRDGVRIPKTRKLTLWPQNILRGIPKGWGSL